MQSRSRAMQKDHGAMQGNDTGARPPNDDASPNLPNRRRRRTMAPDSGKGPAPTQHTEKEPTSGRARQKHEAKEGYAAREPSRMRTRGRAPQCGSLVMQRQRRRRLCRMTEINKPNARGASQRKTGRARGGDDPGGKHLGVEAGWASTRRVATNLGLRRS